MPDWLRELLRYPQFTWTEVLIGAALAVIVSVGGLLAVGFLLVRLPANYFCESEQRAFWIGRHPVLRWTALVIKNIAGVVMVAIGVVLSLPAIPGPGFLTILIGIVLMDFPGKRRLERWFVSRPAVFEAINTLRARRGRPPLVLEQQPTPK